MAQDYEDDVLSMKLDVRRVIPVAQKLATEDEE